jgi:hypothetical protein
MSEMRRIRMKGQAHQDGKSSEFWYENQRYFVSGKTTCPVRQEIASAWASADSNVEVLVER